MIDTGPSKTILLVEDEALIAMNEKALLEKHGYNLLVAYRAEQAIEIAVNKGVDLILMDIDLGEGKMDGTEAAEFILNKKDIPIVFLSSHTDPDIVERTEGITSYGYIVKDSGETVLIASLHMAFRLFEEKQKVKESETALRESEQKYRALFENSPLGIFRSTPEGKFLEVNPALAEMLGYPSQESVIEGIYDIAEQIYVEPEERQPIVEKQLSSPQMDQYYNRYRKKDGSIFTANLYLTTIRDKDGNPLYFEGIVEDITERLKKEKEHREREEEKLLQIMENSPVGFIYIDRDLRITYENKRAKEIMGLPEGESESIALHQDVRQLQSILSTGKMDIIHNLIQGNEIEVESAFTSLYGRESFLRVKGVPLLQEGCFNGAIVMIGDITEKKRNEDALRENEARFRYILKYDPNAIAIYDSDLHYIIASDRYITDYGIEGKEIIGKHHYEVFPEMPQRWKDIHQRVLAGEIIRNDNDSFLRKDGSVIYNRWECRPWYTIDGQIGGMITYTEVTTERVKAEKQKEFLMRELNHRVKNNLLMISSLISLKDAALGDTADLSDIKNQIGAIRMVHEKLHQTDDVVNINVREYVQDLLAGVFALSSKKIEVKSDISVETMQTKVTVPLGLIINELATNALKHGFTDESSPVFSITFGEDENHNLLVLTISNNGAAFPAAIDIENPDTLGLRLVSALVGQIGGTLSLTRKPYPLFTFQFPKGE